MPENLPDKDKNKGFMGVALAAVATVAMLFTGFGWLGALVVGVLSFLGAAAYNTIQNNGSFSLSGLAEGVSSMFASAINGASEAITGEKAFNPNAIGEAGSTTVETTVGLAAIGFGGLAGVTAALGVNRYRTRVRVEEIVEHGVRTKQELTDLQMEMAKGRLPQKPNSWLPHKISNWRQIFTSPTRWWNDSDRRLAFEAENAIRRAQNDDSLPKTLADLPADKLTPQELIAESKRILAQSSEQLAKLDDATRARNTEILTAAERSHGVEIALEKRRWFGLRGNKDRDLLNQITEHLNHQDTPPPARADATVKTPAAAADVPVRGASVDTIVSDGTPLAPSGDTETKYRITDPDNPTPSRSADATAANKTTPPDADVSTTRPVAETTAVRPVGNVDGNVKLAASANTDGASRIRSGRMTNQPASSPYLDTIEVDPEKLAAARAGSNNVSGPTAPHAAAAPNVAERAMSVPEPQHTPVTPITEAQAASKMKNNPIMIEAQSTSRLTHHRNAGGNAAAFALDIKQLVGDLIRGDTVSASASGGSALVNVAAVTDDILASLGKSSGSVGKRLGPLGLMTTPALVSAHAYTEMQTGDINTKFDNVREMTTDTAVGLGGGIVGGSLVGGYAAGSLGMTGLGLGVVSTGGGVLVALAAAGAAKGVNYAMDRMSGGAIYDAEEQRFQANLESKPNMKGIIGKFSKQLADPATGEINWENTETLNRFERLLNDEVEAHTAAIEKYGKVGVVLPRWMRNKRGAEILSVASQTFGVSTAAQLTGVHVHAETMGMQLASGLDKEYDAKSSLQIAQSAQRELQELRRAQLVEAQNRQKIYTLSASGNEFPTLEELDRNKNGMLDKEDERAIREQLGDKKLAENFISNLKHHGLTFEDRTHDLNALNASVIAQKYDITNWQVAHGEKDGQPVYVATNAVFSDPNAAKQKAEALNSTKDGFSLSSDQGFSVTSFGNEHYIAISPRRLQERGAAEVIERAEKKHDLVAAIGDNMRAGGVREVSTAAGVTGLVQSLPLATSTITTPSQSSF